MIHLSREINTSARARRVQRSLHCYRNWKSIVAKNLVTMPVYTTRQSARTDSGSAGIYFYILSVCSGDFSFSNHQTSSLIKWKVSKVQYKFADFFVVA